MKKLFLIISILLLGLVVLGGCTFVTVEPSYNQQNNDVQLEQNEEQVEMDEILTPPALPEE